MPRYLACWIVNDVGVLECFKKNCGIFGQGAKLISHYPSKFLHGVARL